MIQNIFKMLLGNGIAQLIVFCSLPIITRLFDPSIFGMFSSLVALIMLLSVIGTLKLDLALIVCDKKDIAMILFSSLFWALIFSVLILFFWSFWVSESWVLYRAYVAFAVFASSSYMLLAAIVNKSSNYFSLSFSKVVQAITIVSLQILFGFYIPSVEALLLAYALSFIVASFFLLVKAKNNYKGYLKVAVSFDLFTRYRNFIIYQTPANAINTLSQNVFIFILLALFGPAVSGLYALSNRLLLAPSALIGKSTRDVFIQEAAKLSDERDKLKELYFNTTAKLFTIAIPLYGLGAILSYFLFGYIFGAEWNEAGLLFSILCLWGVGLFSNAPATATISVIGIQKFSLLYEVLSLLLRVGAVYIAYNTGLDYIQTTLVFSTLSLLVNLFYIHYVYKKI